MDEKLPPATEEDLRHALRNVRGFLSATLHLGLAGLDPAQVTKMMAEHMQKIDAVLDR